MFDDEAYDDDDEKQISAKSRQAEPASGTAGKKPSRAAVDESSDEDEDEDRPIASAEAGPSGSRKAGASPSNKQKPRKKGKEAPKFGKVKVLEDGPSSGPAVRRARREVTFMDENGYLVTREEWVELEVPAGTDGSVSKHVRQPAGSALAATGTQ